MPAFTTLLPSLPSLSASRLSRAFAVQAALPVILGTALFGHAVAFAEGSAMAPAASQAGAQSAAQPASQAARPKRDMTPVDIDLKSPEAKAAIRKAQATLDEFLKVAAEKNPKYSSVAMRVAVHQGKLTELIWLTPFTVIDKNTFSGQVNSIPTVVSNVTIGQAWRFKRADVVDWMYFDAAGKHMYGNYTTCVLVRKAPLEEQQEMKKRYGLDCTR